MQTDVHHQKLAQSLLDELRKVAPKTAHEFQKMVSMWPFMADTRRRKLLRLAIDGIREGRTDQEAFQKSADARLRSVARGLIEEIYAMEPGEALRRAKDALLNLHGIRGAVELLGPLLEAGADETDDPEHRRRFLRGGEALQGLLREDAAEFAVVLTHGLARAGGHELTDELRALLPRDGEEGEDG